MEKFKAPALAKGLDIIDLIRANGPLSFNEIQAYTADNPASLSRYLHTLMAKDYLFKNNQQKYALGLKLMSLSDTKSLWPKIIRHIKPLMEEINQTFNITVLLLAYTGDTYKAIDKVVAETNLGMMAEGTVRANTLETLWTNRIYNTDIDLSKNETMMCKNEFDFPIKDLVDFVATHGYMKHKAENTNIIRFGFPIRYNDHVIATLGLGSFAQNLAETSQAELIEIVQNAIKNLESTLK